MEKLKKRNKRMLLLLLILCVSLGYALLNATLTINGNSKILQQSWDIHWENVQVSGGSVSIGSGDSAATITPSDNTEVTYEVTLSKPGDFYEFTVDAVNAGTVDAMIDVITSTYKIGNGEVTTITSNNLPDYLEYSVSYSDNHTLSQYQELKANTTETIKVKVAYKRDIDEDDLPDTNQSIAFTFGVEYVQADNNAFTRTKNSLFTTEVDVASVQNAILFTDDYDINYDRCTEIVFGSNRFSNNSDGELYCRGEETSDGNSIQQDIDRGIADNLEDVGIITINNSRYAKANSYDIDKDTCLNIVINNWGYTSEDAELYCNGEETSMGYSIQSDINDGGAVLWLEENGIITNVEYVEVIPEIIITGYSGDVPTNFIIPSTINGSKVIGIADEAFIGKGITSVEIPSTVKYIGDFAFDENTLTRVNVKGNATVIGECAFGKKNDIINNNLPNSYSCIKRNYVVSGTTMQIGQPIPNGVNVRRTPALAMQDWQDFPRTSRIIYPFYIKHTIENNIITESYVEFIVTDDMALENEGMVAGTYSLRGLDTIYYDNEIGNNACKPEYEDGNGICISPYYESNVNTLKTAFGYSTHPERCETSGQAEDGSLSFSCNVSELHAATNLEGNATVFDYVFCDVQSNGLSFCDDGLD